jgi:hypothetical protein
MEFRPINGSIKEVRIIIIALAVLKITQICLPNQEGGRK